MLSLLFFSHHILCSNNNLCTININGKQYDLNALSTELGTMDYQSDNGQIIRYRLCDALKEDDFDDIQHFQNGIQSMVKKDSEIYFLGLTVSQNKLQLNTNSESDEFLLHYYWNDENFTSNSLIKIVLNSSVEKYTITDQAFIEREYYSSFSVTIQTSLVNVVAYEESPREKSSLLECVYRTANANEGIEINLRNYTYNQNGYVTKLGNGMDLMMQPCELISCPQGFKCDSKESLVWICDSSNFNCESYSNNSISFSESDKFEVSYGKFNNKLTTFEYECDEKALWPYYTDYILSDTNLRIKGKMSGACPKPLIPKETEIERNDHFLTVNSDKSNYTGPEKIELESGYELYYNFGNYIECPSGYYCKDSQSVAFICKDAKCRTLASDYIPAVFTPSHERFLNSYSIDYSSNDGSLTANIICTNEDKTKNKFTFQNATYDENSNHGIINILNPDVCLWEWVLSEFPVEDVPSPPSNNSYIIYHENTTHSIKFDLKSLYLAKTLWATSNEAGTMDMSTFLMPGSPMSCPNQNGNYTTDGCFCWKNKEGADVCQATALSGYRAESRLLNSSLDGGFSVTFRGAGYVRTKVNLYCSNPFGEPSWLTYTEPNQFLLAWSHNEACPKHEILPHVPPNPSQTPAPTTENVSIVIDIDDKKLNLENITGKGNVVLDVGGTVERADIIYSLGGIMDCPNNSLCFSKKASIWKCWESNLHPYICVALADARYGYKLRKDEIEYAGGFGGYITTVNLLCDPESSTPTISGNGSEYSMRVSLAVSSNDFCSNDVKENDNNNNVPASVIFLIVVASILVLYLGIGTGINYYRWHRCEIPNSRFWVEFGLCVIDGWKFITCRYKKEGRDSAIPDAIL